MTYIDEARSRMATYFTDRCAISSDPQGPRDDVTLDDGTVIEPADDYASIYRGPCLVSASSYVETTEALGGGSQYRYRYTVSVPVSARVPPNGAAVLITSCPGDPRLKGLTLYVTGASYSGQQARRRLACVLNVPAPL